MSSRVVHHQEVVVLIGDVVDSRSSTDRPGLHQALQRVLSKVNAEVNAQEEGAITVGDEFQAVYASLGAALDATQRIRLALYPTADTRYGIGRGASTTLDSGRGIKDGPAWWAARAAITHVRASAQKGALAQVRTAYNRAGESTTKAGAVRAWLADADDTTRAVNAALQCQDHMIGSLSPRSMRILKRMLGGMTQRDIATAEGISPSAVSQRVRADGLAVVLNSHRLLAGLT